MPQFVDSQILHFDDDLQAEARTVLARSAEPQNSFEVAVILETIGHTDETARARGYGGLFDLANHLYDSLEDFGLVHEQRPNAVIEATEPTRLEVLGQFVGSSLPWLIAIVIQMSIGTGFWSATSLPPRLASGMVLALTVSLVSSALFIVPYSRRGNFYRLQGNRSLAAWTASRILGTGAVVCVAITTGSYLILERGLAAYTPGTTRSFFEMSVAIALLQLALAPLYVMHAFRWLALTVTIGALCLIVGFTRVNHGIFTNPFAVIHVQLLALSAMLVVAVVGSTWTLRVPVEQVATPPRRWAIVRSGAPYGLFGASYFLLVLTSQFVAGGIWHGGFHYQATFATSSGSALLVLLPLLACMSVAGERFSHRARSLLAARSVAEGDAVSGELSATYRRQQHTLVTVGLVSSVTMILLAELLQSHWALAAAIVSHLGLFVSALGAYVALCSGLSSSQTLFSLSRPSPATLGGTIGTLLGLGSAGLTGLVLSDTVAAATGLVIGTLTFAVLSRRAARLCLRDFGAAFFGAI